MARRRPSKKQLTSLAKRLAKFLLASQLFTLFLALCVIGFVVGTSVRRDGETIPYDELFEGMRVVSHRDDPTDPRARFIVELSAGGKVFRRYDVDAQRFLEPERGRSYRRAISNSRYAPFEVRGHEPQGFWLELTDGRTSLLPAQFDVLYQKTLDYVKPLSVASSMLGTLSGYSIGYRMAAWPQSLSNPKVQERVLESPGIGRTITREAWRRVLLEPMLMGQEDDVDRFHDLHGTQRLYTNFFKVALRDSDGFIPREAARLDSLGRRQVAATMRAFTRAVSRASRDEAHLSSVDFAAVEQWASLLDRNGHWSLGATPSTGAERIQYFGTLAWYGLAPTRPDEHRVWVGPRLLVREGDTEGFVADDILATGVACPEGWREWIGPDDPTAGANGYVVQWMGGAREFAPVVRLGRRVVDRVRGGS